VWVGPDFFNSLSDNLDSVALQGVDSSAYGATLEEYLGEGGSEAGAQSMAQTLESYAACCPTTALVLSGWNQGALVAHKALGMLNAQTASQVAGFVTFGSPYRLFDDIPSVPSHIPTNYQCIEGFNFDPLCASLPEGFRFPDSAWDVIEPFNKLPHFAQGVEETEAAAYMLIQFPAELIEGWSSFVHTLVHDQWARLMITPQSFMYGNDGMAKHAGDWVARLPKVSAPRSS
jgi:cutinase